MLIDAADSDYNLMRCLITAASALCHACGEAAIIRGESDAHFARQKASYVASGQEQG
jgi:hypothetical protein